VFTARYGINLLNITQLIFFFNPQNAELKPICHLPALLGAHHILHVNRIRVTSLIIIQFDTTDALRNGRRPSIWRKHTHVDTKIDTIRRLIIVLDAARCRQDFTPQCLQNWITFRLQVGNMRILSGRFRLKQLVSSGRKWKTDPFSGTLSYKSQSPSLYHAISAPKCVMITILM
jgi:hypothetical protein